MEESELEEGEACSYNLTNDFGSSFDPDNDLSYIVRFISFFFYIYVSVLLTTWIMNCVKC